MRRTFLTICLLSCTFAPACGTADPPTRRYHARGQVSAVNGSGPDLTISIHHELISNFEDRDGKRAAMPSMVMAFGVAPEVPRDVWSQGKKVAFDFDVRWSKQPTLYIVKAEPLPADAALTLTTEH